MNRLNEWLQNKNMTQQELADRLHFSRVYVNRVANATEQPSEGFMWRFFQTFGQDATVEAFDLREQET